MASEHEPLPYVETVNDTTRHSQIHVLDTFDDYATGVYEPLQRDIRGKIIRALQDYGVFDNKTVTVGRLEEDSRDEVNARAHPWNLIVLFPTDETSSFTTVYHELEHLAIHIKNEEQDADLPETSEEFCSISAVSRMPPNLVDTDYIPYIGDPTVPQEEWPNICQRALEYRESHRNYIQKCREWLGTENHSH